MYKLPRARAAWLLRLTLVTTGCEPAVKPDGDTAGPADSPSDSPADTAPMDADGDGWTAAAGDCDDDSADAHPDAAEVCDGIDNDCDGLTDDEDTDVGYRLAFYGDADGDGYAYSDYIVLRCSIAEGLYTEASDCDDDDASVHPGATEICDERDNDCDEAIDDEDPDVVVTEGYYLDDDHDGHGDPAVHDLVCAREAGWVAEPDDCDDTNGAIHPDADEVCDGVDNDCDGAVDDGDPDVMSETSWYTDADGDSYGDAASAVLGCEPLGLVRVGTDCDDADAETHPGADEVCDSVDNDCDGDTDDEDLGVLATDTWYADFDEDGYGDPIDWERLCVNDGGRVADASDCDDADADINPDAVEVCDGADNDCDGDTDDEDSDAPGTTPHYADADGDGYGDADLAALRCEAGDGWVSDATDCLDSEPSVHPGAPELCDTLDNDCDGAIDDADEDYTDGPLYLDEDRDGYGVAQLDGCAAPGTASVADGDCDDDDPTVYPGANEVRHEALDGTITDLTATFSAGTSASPASYAFAESGTLRLCPGTWYTGIEITAADAEIAAVSDDPAETVLTGADVLIELLGTNITATVRGLTLADAPQGVWGMSTVNLALTLEDVTLRDLGGALTNTTSPGISMTGQLDLIDCTITGVEGQWSALSSGTALQGGAVMVIGEADISGTTIEGNGLDMGYCTGSSGYCYGGGIYVEGALSLSDSVVSDNSCLSAIGPGTTSYTAWAYVYGGGIAVVGDAQITDSVVTANVGSAWALETAYNAVGTIRGAGIWLQSGTLTLEDSVVSSNQTTFTGDNSRNRAGGGGVYIEEGSLDCTATSSGGITSNLATDEGGALYWDVTAGAGYTLTSDGCDWGSSADGDDNDVGDIGGTVTVTYDGVASFTCDSSGCI